MGSLPKFARPVGGLAMSGNGTETNPSRHHNESTPVRRDYPVMTFTAGISGHPSAQSGHA